MSDIREDDARGRHTTTRRELVLLPGGGVLVDTPGMRELGLVEDDGGIDAAFADIAEIAQACRFNDCLHESEPGCAVQSALNSGHSARSGYRATASCSARLRLPSGDAIRFWPRTSADDGRRSTRSYGCGRRQEPLLTSSRQRPTGTALKRLSGVHTQPRRSTGSRSVYRRQCRGSSGLADPARLDHWQEGSVPMTLAASVAWPCRAARGSAEAPDPCQS